MLRDDRERRMKPHLYRLNGCWWCIMRRYDGLHVGRYGSCEAGAECAYRIWSIMNGLSLK
jgi:hypothetical protein